MWTDIDYMYSRWIFTNDPDYFPLDRMREIVDYLHSHDQYYGKCMLGAKGEEQVLTLCHISKVMMTDPAVAYQPGGQYGTYNRGAEQDIYLKEPNGSVSLGIVWPGGFPFGQFSLRPSPPCPSSSRTAEDALCD